MFSSAIRGVLTSLFVLPAAVGAQASGCYTSTTDPLALRLLDFARFSVGSTDSTAVAARTIVGLPAVDSAKIVLTADARTCASIVSALNTFLKTPGAVRRVQVAKLVSSGFLAYDGYAPTVANAGSNPVYFLSKQFAVKSVLLGL